MLTYFQRGFKTVNTTVYGEKAGERFLIAKTNNAGVYIPCKPSEHCS
ncbi:hypothetical protein ACN38_g6305, partial [Penicillium nordicum]